MSQPSAYPRLADTVSTDPTRVAEPIGAQKDVGYQEGERIPSQHFNWFILVIYQWILWLVSRTRVISPFNFAVQGGGTDWTATAASIATASVASPALANLPIVVEVGETISSVVLRVHHTVATLASMKVRLCKYDLSTHTVSAVASATSAAVNTAQDLTLTMTETVDGLSSYYLEVGSNGGTGGAMFREVYGGVLTSSKGL